MSFRLILAIVGVGAVLALISASGHHGRTRSARQWAVDRPAGWRAEGKGQEEAFAYDPPVAAPSSAGTAAGPASLATVVEEIEKEVAPKDEPVSDPAMPNEAPAVTHEEPAVIEDAHAGTPAVAQDAPAVSPEVPADAPPADAPVADAAAVEVAPVGTPALAQEAPAVSPDVPADAPAATPAVAEASTTEPEEPALAVARVDEAPASLEEMTAGDEPVPAEAVVWVAPESAEPEVGATEWEYLALVAELEAAAADPGPQAGHGDQVPGTEPVQTSPAPVVAQLGPDEDDVAFAAVVEEMSETFAADLAKLQEPGPGPAAPEVRIADAAAEPAAPADEDLGTSVADALNRASEGLGPMPTGPEPAAEPTGPVASSPAPGNDLAKAVRLTRDALVAWVSLLHGPAVVTLPH